MKGRLFLGIRIGHEHRAALKEADLCFTTLDGKDFCGFVIPPHTSLQQLQEHSKQLELTLHTHLPGVRLPAAILFSELLIG